MPDELHLVIDDDLHERLIELTGGAAALCYQCGTCTASCPWGLVREEHLPVRTIIHQAQLGVPGWQSNLWLCTTCGQCEVLCPRGVKVTDVFRGLRELAWEERRTEKGLPSLLWSIYWNENPWSQPPSQRDAWSKGLGIPEFDPEQHEVLLYIGCTSSFDRRAQKVARALVSVLNAAGVKYGYLGNDEPCCGESALSVGHLPYFNEIAHKTTERFREKEVIKVVTISPHCYDVFKNHYPNDKPFEVFHYTQYLAQLIEDGRLKLTGSVKEKITFQDPCYLGRHNNEYAAPRSILAAIPGTEIVEMPRNRSEGLCCGGGGGRMWLETVNADRFSNLRAKEASETGAGILATACPFCIVCLEDSAKNLALNKIRVLDIAEVVALALEK
ncbi:MAG: (Fe-S)-binding protein [Anaerolineaceae bacterium]